MMPPSALVKLPVELEELELPPRSAMRLSINDEMMACADSALVEDAVPEELEVLPDRKLMRLWYAELKLEVTLLEPLELPLRLPINSLSSDSVARLASAATVEAWFAVELAVVLVLDAEVAEVAVAAVFAAEAALEALKRLDSAVAC